MKTYTLPLYFSVCISVGLYLYDVDTLCEYKLIYKR